MATYQRRKSKRYGERITATVRVHPYPPQSETFDRMTDARAWAEDLESDIRNGRFRPMFQGAKRTLAELIDRYIEDTFELRRSPAFPRMALDWWKERMGHYRLADLSRAAIRNTWKSLEDGASDRTGRPRKNRTLNAYLENLSACLSFGARELEWLEINPALGLTRKSISGNWRLRLLSDDELQRLLDAVKSSSNDYLYPAVLMALATGARRGELMGLTWDDVNLAKGEVTFHRTKNGFSRTVAISPSAIAVLREHGRVRRLGSTLLFPARKPLWKDGIGSNSNPWENLQRPFARAMNAAKISDFHWHDLRHQAASLLLASGASLEEVGKILGHRTPQMTWRYAKLLQHRNVELVCAVDEKFIRRRIAG